MRCQRGARRRWSARSAKALEVGTLRKALEAAATAQPALARGGAAALEERETLKAEVAQLQQDLTAAAERETASDVHAELGGVRASLIASDGALGAGEAAPQPRPQDRGKYSMLGIIYH